jgi:hypothetical protein
MSDLIATDGLLTHDGAIAKVLEFSEKLDPDSDYVKARTTEDLIGEPQGHRPRAEPARGTGQT